MGLLSLASLGAGLTAARLLGALAMMLTTLILTHQFGTEVAASFAVCTALATTLSNLGLAGLQGFAPILTAEYSKTGQHGHLRAFASMAVLSSITLTGSLACAVWIGFQTGLLSQIGFNLTPEVAQTACLIAIFMTVSSLSSGILSGRHQQPKAQLPESLFRPFLMLTLMAGLALFSVGSGEREVLLAALLAFAASAVILSLFMVRDFRTIPLARFRLDLRRWLRTAPPWLAINLAWDNVIELTLLVAAAVAGPTEVLLLFICFRLRMLLGFGVRSIYSITQPRIYEALAVDDKASAQATIDLTNILTTAYSLVALAFITVFSEPLLGLFGSEFVEGRSTLLLVCILIVVRSVLGPSLAVLAGKGKHNLVALVLLPCLAFALALSPWLYGMIGILGFTVSYLFANTIAAIVLWWLARHQLGIDSAIWAMDFRTGLTSIARMSVIRVLRPFSPKA